MSEEIRESARKQAEITQREAELQADKLLELAQNRAHEVEHNLRGQLNFGIDGGVVKVDALGLQDELGVIGGREPPPLVGVGCSALATGESLDPTTPVTTTLPEASEAIPRPSSNGGDARSWV